MSLKQKKKALDRKEQKSKMLPRASLNKLSMSARKIRPVANMIRGCKLERAIELLKAQKKLASRPLCQVLYSAMANAEQKNMDVDNLIVQTIEVDGGPIARRFMPRAQGRATRIRKRTSHINVTLNSL